MASAFSWFPFGKEHLSDHIRVGKEGEEAAASFLRGLGYDIRHRNCRLGKDEIDIVAFDPTDSVLVFCEVKSRSASRGEYSPELAFTERKKGRMRAAARKFVAREKWEGGYRLDLLLVEGGNVTQHLVEVAES